MKLPVALVVLICGACHGDPAVPAARPLLDAAPRADADPAPRASTKPPAPVVELATAWYGTAARLADGRVFVWGHFLDNPGQAQATPVELPFHDVHALTAAGGHAYYCAVGEDRGATCLARLPRMYGVGWGDSWAAADHTTLPTGRDGGGVRSIGATEYHGCAALLDGSVRCWGLAGSGLLGEAGGDRAATPLTVKGITRARAIAVGTAHACALRDDATIWCWGGDDHGELGEAAEVTGTPARISENHASHEITVMGGMGRPRPLPVAGLDHVTQVVAASFFTCALRADGTVWCWGTQLEGVLGDGVQRGQSRTPRPVAGLAGVAEIAGGGDAMCARRGDGHVVCWGHDQAHDESGLATTTSPHEIAGLDDAQRIGAGTYGGCAVRTSGEVACWGSRRFGALGDGMTKGNASLSTVRWPGR